MITQAVVGVLQFHSEHENVFLSDCIILPYLLSHLSHSVGPRLCVIETTESNILVFTHSYISAGPFLERVASYECWQLHSLPAPFPWAQCEFHWKYIHPIKGTSECKDEIALLQKLALDAEQWIPILGPGTGGCHTWVQIPPPPLSHL